jgi:hypothetical protein
MPLTTVIVVQMSVRSKLLCLDVELMFRRSTRAGDIQLCCSSSNTSTSALIAKSALSTVWINWHSNTLTDQTGAAAYH